MINTLEVRNYKAFENAVIPIKPITILLGANSVGKSSIIQLLLLLQQTGKEDIKSYTSALKLYGGHVNLGDSVNLFHKLNTSKEIELKFTIESKDLKEYCKNLYTRYIDYATQIPRYVPIKSFLDLRHREVKSRIDFEKYIDALISVLKKEGSKTEYVDEIKWFLSRRDYSIILQLADLTRTRKKYTLDTYDLLWRMSNIIKNDSFSISFSIAYSKKNIQVTKLGLSHLDTNILNFSKDFFQSDLIKIEENIKDEIIKQFSPSNTIFNVFKKEIKGEDSLSSISSAYLSIINYALNILNKEFVEDKINYVSPLRAHPKRYYMLDKAKVNLTLDTLDGDAIAEVLKENSSLKNNVNKWLGEFGLSVDVEEFKEVVHHLKVNQNKLNLDITDVGFGISQVLPVIIQGFLSSPYSTTIIEQPEIHLHPKMQADLADLFIDIVRKGKNKKLVIETHSEYLLKRLRRRISEGTINADDVSICLFNPQTESNGGTIENLKIEHKGFFEWPVDFYGGEILKDTTEFLMNQNK